MKKLMWFKDSDLVPDDAKYLMTEPGEYTYDINPNGPGMAFIQLKPYRHLYEVPVSAPATIPSPPHDGAGYFGEDK